MPFLNPGSIFELKNADIEPEGQFSGSPTYHLKRIEIEGGPRGEIFDEFTIKRGLFGKISVYLDGVLTELATVEGLDRRIRKLTLWCEEVHTNQFAMHVKELKVKRIWEL